MEGREEGKGIRVSVEREYRSGLLLNVNSVSY